MTHKAEVWPSVKCDSASTWTVRQAHPVSDMILMDELVQKHKLLRTPSPTGHGYTFHLYGMRADLEAATAAWNARLETNP